MRISVVGWYGMKNVGDEAFHYVLGNFLEGHEVEFITPPRICNNPDIVILGGGAVASPFYLNTLPDCPRYALGIDLAYESEADLLARANFKEIYVRTKTDAEALKAKVSCPVHAIPDLAYYLKPQGLKVLESNKPLIGVFATDYILPAIDRPYADFADRGHQFVFNLASELDKLAREGNEIVLVPCSTDGYGNDIRVNLDIAAYMKTRPTVLLNTYHPRTMIDLIGCLDMAVCMRFHSHIFSMIAAKPFVSIELTRKVKLWLKEHDLEANTAVRQEIQTVPLSYTSCKKEPRYVWDSFAETVKAAKFQDVSRLRSLAVEHQTRLEEVKQQVRSKWLGEGS